METILLVAFTEADGTLAKPALESLSAAKNLAGELGASLVVGLAGANAQGAAAQLAGSGATRCLAVTGADFAQARYGSDAAALEALGKAAQATLVLVSGTARVNRVISGVAHRLQGKVDTHVTGLTSAGGKVSISRWYYRQRMEAAIQRVQRPWIIVVDPGCFAPWQATGAAPALETLTVSLPDSAKRTTVTGIQTPASNAQTIRPEAELLFVTGAGWTKKQADGQPHVKEAEKIIWDFLQASRASLGSSKSLVDLGGEGVEVLSFLTHMNQIGQTGSTPRHAKGLATCCHGEEPHAVGWRFINERRAVNLDAACGWARGKADVLYVADAFAVMRKVNELLAAQGK
jgi:electron transfer flavoprotein alpha subunit